MRKGEGPLNLRDVVFDVCGGPVGDQFHLDGGSLYTEEISVELTSVEFRKSRAKKAGAYYGSTGDIFMSDVSFLQCEASKDCGALCLEDCNLVVTRSYFVRNHAGQKYGAIYVRNGFVKFYTVYIYENNATAAFAGITLVDCLGHILTCRFIDNHSPLDDGGTALYVPSTSDLLIVEYCNFGGFSKYYIRYDVYSQVRAFECCFDVAEEDAKFNAGQLREGESSVEVGSAWYQHEFYGQCNPEERLPSRYYQEIFARWLDAQPIEWWKLYSGLGIFLAMVGLMAFSVPAVFFPIMPGGTRRGNSVNPV